MGTQAWSGGPEVLPFTLQSMKFASGWVVKAVLCLRLTVHSLMGNGFRWTLSQKTAIFLLSMNASLLHCAQIGSSTKVFAQIITQIRFDSFLTAQSELTCREVY
jgi:hypothetical protein